jgi:hypothetical protein
MQLQRKYGIQRIIQRIKEKREKIQALSLAKKCYSMKLNLLTNATVVDDAIMLYLGNQEIMRNQNYLLVIAMKMIKNRKGV